MDAQVGGLSREASALALHVARTSASWFNLVDGFFAEFTMKRIRCGTSAGVSELEEAIHDHLDEHNADPNLYAWMKTANATRLRL